MLCKALVLGYRNRGYPVPDLLRISHLTVPDLLSVLSQLCGRTKNDV